MKLAELLRAYRWKNGMTGTDLAREIGIDDCTLAKIENNSETNYSATATIILWLTKRSA